MQSYIPFSPQTWLKSDKQTTQQFKQSVQENIETLAEKGYDTEAIWLNSDGTPCQTVEEINNAEKCIIVEKKEVIISQQPAWLKPYGEETAQQYIKTPRK
jgi:hypothetical protein